VRTNKVTRGTNKGYHWHRRRNEKACDPCNDAHNATNKAYGNARARAIKSLIHHHHNEYMELLAQELKAQGAH
jgi:hypothetical protein